MWSDLLTQTGVYLKEKNDFLVVSHTQPDGDAISSTVAIGWVLKQLGKSYILMNEDPVPKRLQFLWHSDKIIPVIEANLRHQKYNHVICVDCADFARMGKLSGLLDSNVEILNIDHHVTNENYGQLNLVKTSAAATVEILFELINKLDLALNLEVGTAIYTGLLTDTGGFRYPNTSPFVLNIASQLLSLGVNGSYLAEILLERMPLGQMRLLQCVLANLQLSEDHKMAWTSITSAEVTAAEALREDLEGLVNYMRNIDGVEVGILFKENKEQSIKVSFRSAGKVNVSAVAQKFGGGGHLYAAGAILTSSLPEAIDKVVREVKKALITK